LIRDLLFNGLYLGLMLINTLLIVFTVGGYYLLPLLIVLQGFFMVGQMEMLHQAVHSNLFTVRWINNFFGFLAGILHGISFIAYKRFHIIHHGYCNTAKDPEKHYYPIKSPLRALLLYPSILLIRNANVINSGRYLKMENGDLILHKLNMICIFVIPIASILLTVEYPKEMLLAYWLPYVVFFYVELFMAQSQHYFSDERATAPRQNEQYKEAVNILLPWPLGFLCLYTNHHATHHVHPSAKWHQIPTKTHEDAEYVFSLSLFDFIRTCLKHGAREWRVKSVAINVVSLPTTINLIKTGIE